MTNSKNIMIHSFKDVFHPVTLPRNIFQDTARDENESNKVPNWKLMGHQVNSTYDFPQREFFRHSDLTGKSKQR